ncbi:hypothetical protein CG723_08915 [Streptomyces sp. CB01635]|uniref:hypothetical protein n=1 Tax=unclassified Streptomyces TaxID=2593676 RepID=UPI000C277E06|nr:hypothetical protein [Streptomyces sp. CB01635]PJN11083.1 hypothetical protein CG723_08915 [Streptomyces sp. CB01635]
MRLQAGYWTVKPWFNGLSRIGSSYLAHIGATLVTPHIEALQTPWTRRSVPDVWDIPVQLKAGLVALELRAADSEPADTPAQPAHVPHGSAARGAPRGNPCSTEVQHTAAALPVPQALTRHRQGAEGSFCLLCTPEFDRVTVQVMACGGGFTG